MSVAAVLKQIIIDELGVEEEAVTADAMFTDDLGADSLQAVELVMAIEEEFGIEIPDDDAEKIDTVGDAVKYIEAALAGTLSPAPVDDPSPPGDTVAPASPPVIAAPPPAGPTAIAAGDDEDDETLYAVIVNAEEKYAIWPADREVPAGWRATGPQGTKRESLAYIASLGDDPRPQSLRPKLPGD